MENQLISLKKTKPKNYEVCYGDRLVGVVIDDLRFNFGVLRGDLFIKF